jgi:hypothetical protein
MATQKNNDKNKKEKEMTKKIPVDKQKDSPTSKENLKRTILDDDDDDNFEMPLESDFNIRDFDDFDDDDDDF